MDQTTEVENLNGLSKSVVYGVGMPYYDLAFKHLMQLGLKSKTKPQDSI
jgi:hypothetical protein